MMESNSDENNSSDFIESSNEKEELKTSQQYSIYKKTLPPPEPLFPRNQFTDEPPKSHIRLLQNTNRMAPRIIGEERIYYQGSEVSPNHSQGSNFNLDTYYSQKQDLFSESRLVFKRFETVSFDNTLNLRQLASKNNGNKLIQINVENTLQNYTTVSEGSLQFESRFESGNLSTAYKKSDAEYDLLLQNDINSRGHTQ